jgi:putative tail protein
MTVFSTIIAIVSATGLFTIGPVAGFLLKTVLAVGLNRLSMHLSKGDDPKQTSAGIKGTLQRGADLPQTIMLGAGATAGSLDYANTWGTDGDTPNAFFTMVVSLCDMPVQSLDAIWVNGSKCTINGAAHADYGYPINEFTDGGGEHAWVKFYDGTQIYADAFLQHNVQTAERPWDGNAIGTGTAYAIVTTRTHKTFWSNGFPSFLFEVTGLPLYDISKDSSVGGSGSHRWDNPSTWGGDGDHLVAVQKYNTLRGIYYGSEWVYGLQNVTAAQLPSAHWIAQVQACRAGILGISGNEPTYRSAGELSVGAPISDAAQVLLDACNGRLSEAGGAYKLFVGGVGSSAASFDDGIILSTEEQTFTPFFGLADTVNGITAKYPAPLAGWQLETAPALLNADLEAEDGDRRLLVGPTFDFVPYPEQVQRLMKGALNEARRARRHTISLPPEYWRLEPGDIVTWTSTRNGYSAKQYRIDGAVDLGNCDVILDITEIDPNDYDFVTGTDYKPVATPGILPQAIPSQEVVSFAVSAVAIQDAGETDRRPGIQCTWNPDVDDIEAIKVQVRIKEIGTTFLSARFDDFEEGNGSISSGLLPAVEYEVRGKYIPGSARDTEWSDWLSVTTDNLLLSTADISPEAITLTELGQEVRDQIDSAGDANVSAQIAAILAGGNLILDPTAANPDNWGNSGGGVISGVTHEEAGPVSDTAIRVTMPADGNGGTYTPEIDIGSFSGRTYKVNARARFNTGCSGDLGIQVYHLLAGDTWTGGTKIAATPAVTDTFQEIETAVEQAAGTGNKVRFRFFLDNAAEGDWFEVTDLFGEDVTESLAAFGSASAASSSADSASGFADDAGESAEAASGHANTASGQAGIATAKAGEAATYQSNAGNSAAAALEAKELSAYSQQAAVGGNIVINGQCIANIDGWSVGANAAITWADDTDQTKPTDGCLELEVATVGSGSVNSVGTRVYTDLKAGTIIDYSFWSRRVGAGVVSTRMKIQMARASDGTLKSHYGGWKPETDTLSKKTGTFTLTEDATDILITMQINDQAGLLVGDKARFSDITAYDTTSVKQSAGHAADALVSKNAAAVSKTGADDAAAGAASSATVAASIFGGGAFENPIWAEWTGPYPEGVNGSETNGSSINKITGKYGNAIELVTGSELTASRPYIDIAWSGSRTELPDAENCKGVRIELELEKTAGVSWGGARIQIEWAAGGTGGTDSTRYLYFADHMNSDQGRQTLTFDFLRDDETYVAGSVPGEVNIRIHGTTASGGYSYVKNTTVLHALNVRALTTAASAVINQQAIVDLAGNAAASHVIQVTAGEGTALGEFYAADAVGVGPATKIRFTADEMEIIADMIVGGKLKSSNFVAGVSGWQLDLAGTLEAVSVIAQSAIINGAVITDKIFGNAVSISRYSFGADDQSITFTPSHNCDIAVWCFCLLQTNWATGSSCQYLLQRSGATISDTITLVKGGTAPSTPLYEKDRVLVAQTVGYAGTPVTIKADFTTLTGQNCWGTARLMVLEFKR